MTEADVVCGWHMGDMGNGCQDVKGFVVSIGVCWEQCRRNSQ
jgi:hypothetical protein